MKIKELFTIGNGLFEKYFKPEYPTEYKTLFGDTPPRKLDVFTLLNYGDRELTPTINDANVNDIVSAVIAINVPSWIRIAQVMNITYDPINPIQSVHSITESKDISETGTGTNVEGDKAFNDVEITDTNRETNTDTSTRKETLTREDSTRGTGVQSIAEIIGKEITLRSDNYYKNIIFAIIKELTLSIYL